MENEVPEEDDLTFELGYDEDQSGYIVEASGRPRLFGPWAGEHAFFARGLDNTDGKLTQAAALLKQGWGATHFDRTGIAGRWAVQRLRMALEIVQGERLLCGCGRDSRHKGACSYRRSISEAFKLRTVNAKSRAQIAREYRVRKKERQRIWKDADDVLSSVLANAFNRGSWRDITEAERIDQVAGAFPTGNAIRRIDAWHQCADPKPPWGLFLRITKDLAAVGALKRDGAANNAPYYRETAEQIAARL